jgi:hypothetical protein
MREETLSHLVKEGCIMSYDIKEYDHEENVIDVNIKYFPAFNKKSLAAKLSAAYTRAKGLYRIHT